MLIPISYYLIILSAYTFENSEYFNVYGLSQFPFKNRKYLRNQLK